VGRHARSWAKHRTITDPAHDQARTEMRRFAAKAAVVTGDDVEVRDLSIYDRALGVIG
jgi:hypothetical protein